MAAAQASPAKDAKSHSSGGELRDDAVGEIASAHIGKGAVIQHIILIAGAQKIEKVEPALGLARAKPSEVIIADLGAVGVLAPMLGAGIIDADPLCRLKSGSQNIAGFGKEALYAPDQQADDLALRNPIQRPAPAA